MICMVHLIKYKTNPWPNIPLHQKTLRKNIVEQLIDALKSDEVINAIIPVLTEKLIEVIETHVQSIVDNDIKPLAHIFESQQKQYRSLMKGARNA